MPTLKICEYLQWQDQCVSSLVPTVRYGNSVKENVLKTDVWIFKKSERPTLNITLSLVGGHTFLAFSKLLTSKSKMC